jgi:hypothetical protein
VTRDNTFVWEHNSLSFSAPPSLCGVRNVKDENVMTLEYFNVAVSTSEQLLEDGQVRPKNIAVNCDFNVILN